MSASFCPQCGAKLLPYAKFCSKCGTTIENEPAVQPQVQTSGFCAECGAPLLVGAVCCSKCGADVDQPAEPSRVNVTPVRSAPQPDVQPNTYQQSANTQSIRSQAAQLRNAAVQLGRVTSAPATGGEFVLDMPNANALDGVSELMDPFRAVFSGITRIFSGFKNVGKNPAALISAVVTAVMWVVFMIWDQSARSNKFSEVMSFLTFAEGGSLGTTANKIGGICGKGVVVSGSPSNIRKTS